MNHTAQPYMPSSPHQPTPSNPSLLLYTYRRCPYAMRARMGLLVAQIPFTAYEIELRNKPDGLLKASPKGTVPVLVQPNGVVIDQSWDIVHWALTHPIATSHAHAWWARAQTPDHHRLLALNDGEFKHHLDRYKYPERFETASQEAKAAFRQANREWAMSQLLLPLEQQLTGAAYLGGGAPCATDIGIFPFVRQFAAVDSAWFGALPVPHVQAWLKSWTESTLFRHSMHKLEINLVQAFPLMLSSTPEKTRPAVNAPPA